jgi:hypothetical protein
MRLRKVASPARQFHIASVTIEPHPGVSDEVILAELHKIGAHQVAVLAPGFISADASLEALRGLEEIAHIEIKPEHQLHDL